MNSKHYEALSEAFPDFGWREVRAEEQERMGRTYAFVVEAPDGSLHGAVPFSQSEPDEDGWVGYSPLDGNVPFEQPSADAIEARGYSAPRTPFRRASAIAQVAIESRSWIAAPSPIRGL
jgi:hypothetical protein